jgi:hypothetical protein
VAAIDQIGRIPATFDGCKADRREQFHETFFEVRCGARHRRSSHEAYCPILVISLSASSLLIATDAGDLQKQLDVLFVVVSRLARQGYHQPCLPHFGDLVAETGNGDVGGIVNGK